MRDGLRVVMLAIVEAEGPIGPGPEQRVYAPRDVAARLGISVAGLRRLAVQYERTFGDLPRDERGRLWPEDAVERLEAAHDLVRAGHAVSTEAALRGRVEWGPPVGIGAEPAATGGIRDPKDAAARELRTLRWAIEEQNRIMEGVARALERQGERLEALEEENRRLRAELPTAAGSSSPPAQPVPEASPAEQTDAPDGVGPGQSGEQPAGEEEPTRLRGGLWRRVRRFIGLPPP